MHVDLTDPAFVDPADDAQLLSNLVWAGGARLVRDVWVAGRQLVCPSLNVELLTAPQGGFNTNVGNVGNAVLS